MTPQGKFFFLKNGELGKCYQLILWKEDQQEEHLVSWVCDEISKPAISHFISPNLIDLLHPEISLEDSDAFERTCNVLIKEHVVKTL